MSASEHLPDMIIGVLVAVGLLIFIAMIVKPLFNSDKEAKALINEMEGKIKALDEGQSNTFGMTGVDGWILLGWNRQVPTNEKPQFCFDKNCICLCKGPKCEENLCREIDRSVEVKSSGYVNSNVITIAGEFSSNCLIFDKPLNPVTITKTKSNVLISTNYETVDSIPAITSCPASKIPDWKPTVNPTQR
jgi:hypothetical protein